MCDEMCLLLRGADGKRIKTSDARARLQKKQLQNHQPCLQLQSASIWVPKHSLAFNCEPTVASGIMNCLGSKETHCDLSETSFCEAPLTSCCLLLKHWCLYTVVRHNALKCRRAEQW